MAFQKITAVNCVFCSLKYIYMNYQYSIYRKSPLVIYKLVSGASSSFARKTDQRKGWTKKTRERVCSFLCRNVSFLQVRNEKKILECFHWFINVLFINILICLDRNNYTDQSDTFSSKVGSNVKQSRGQA